ncbi:MAG: glycine--tRNA ligase subunit beta [Desulfobulbus sp.]|jgi:glycyl-tRNA synthetase beta chain|nr:glycine--tRNA ligase subunit beta [Desulfobulbus sp.]
MHELLFEIGTEEIPAGYIQPALNAVAANAARKLQNLGLAFTGVHTCGTPRRLTLVIDDIQPRQPDRCQEHVGPSTKAGFDADGNLTKAAIGFARSRGLRPEQLQVKHTAKGEYLVASEDVQGREALSLLPEVLEALIRELVFPKSMRWANKSLTFARPIQWLLGVYHGQTISLSVENIVCANTTRGHRFMAPEAFVVDSFAAYQEGLAARFVIVDPAERRRQVVEEVWRAVREHAAIPGAQPVLHEGLLDTVANLVEQPFGICGRFDEKFLQLPEEALVTSMREHQKYFPVAGGDGRLLPLFVAVNNTTINDLRLARSGHERVLRARLEDGLFFFNEDRKRPLADRCRELQGIVFQNQLGTMEAKSARITTLAGILAAQIAPNLQEDARRVAQLAKADLLTAMVGEFPSLQGIMGRVYAAHDGESRSVAQAIEEHYLPLRSGGDLPQSLLGGLVAIADRLDTLVGCFAIGEKPTGNKDAFGLRRQAIGLISIIRGLKLRLSLRETATAALAGYAGVVEQNPETVTEVLTFIRLRFENEQVAGGLPQEMVEAATSVGCDDLLDCLARIDALGRIRAQKSFSVLAGSFKRIRNIIKENQSSEVRAELLSEEAEQKLFATLAEVRKRALPLVRDRAYLEALHEMLTMKEPVDRFFDQVMVMADDPAVRQNRLNLLTALGEVVLQVGDISKMHVDRE